jgi:2-polyprenyl-3-methyl-5-hydroxy-6-metoxy-1,4-benzoquinol methylase
MLDKNPCSRRIYQNSGNPPLLKLIPERPGACLDCGCGAGDNARLLKSRGWKVTGITVSADERHLAAEFCEQVYLSDLENGIPRTIEGSFDLILISHVLEHLANPENLIRDCQRVLLPEGMIAVAVPNILFYPNRLRFLLGHFEYTENGVMDKTHLRFYSFKSAAALLESNGFELVVLSADGSIPLWKIRNFLPSRMVERMNRWACRWRPGLFGFQTLILGKVSQ